jgi:hypothetical protein
VKRGTLARIRDFVVHGKLLLHGGAQNVNAAIGFNGFVSIASIASIASIDSIASIASIVRISGAARLVH